MLKRTFEQAYPLARRAAQVRAAAAVLAGVVPGFEGEDLMQEGLIASWRAIPHYDAGRASLRTFVEHVVAKRLTSVVRCSRRRPASDPIELAPEPSVGPDVGSFEAVTDIGRVLASMADGERQLARLLMEYSPSQVSRLLGVARSTVYERIRKLRPHFVDAGFGPQTHGGGGRHRA
jgi:RNA polymerase sigma factor (sigma-70 family)